MTTLDRDDAIARTTEPQYSLVGILLMMCGALAFSVMFLLVKLVRSNNIFTVVLYRSFVQIAISLCILYRKKTNPLGPPGVRWELTCRAVFGGIAVAAFFFGVQVLPLPDAVVLQFTTPAFAAAFAVIMVGETWWPLDMIGAVICLCGVVLIAHPTCLFGESGVPADGNGDTFDSSALTKALAVFISTGGAAAAGVAYVMVRVIGDRADAVGKFLFL